MILIMDSSREGGFHTYVAGSPWRRMAASMMVGLRDGMGESVLVTAILL